MSKLIETIINIKGDKYELFQTGKSYKSVVTHAPRTIKKTGKVIYLGTDSRKHKYYEAALTSTMRMLFKGVWVA